MANTDKPTDKVETEQTVVDSDKPARPAGSKIAIMLSLIAIIVALGGIYVVSKDWQAMQSNTASLTNQADQVTDSLAEIQQALAAQQAASTAAQQSITDLEEKTGRSNNGWVLAEAKYLINLADYNLEFSHNTKTAIALLQAADRRVASLNGLKLLKLRAALTDDISRLSALPEIDLTGLLLKINAVSSAVAKLPLIDKTQSTQQDKKSADSTTASTGQPMWKRGLDNTLATLKTLVVIRHNQQNIEPLISPKQQSYLMENIQLQLANAQWALLNQQPAIYQHSLKQASNWIQHYFVTNSPATKSALTTLAMLQKQQIVQQLPKLSQSLNAINSVLNKQPPTDRSKATEPAKKIKKQPAVEV